MDTCGAIFDDETFSDPTALEAEDATSTTHSKYLKLMLAIVKYSIE